MAAVSGLGALRDRNPCKRLVSDVMALMCLGPLEEGFFQIRLPALSKMHIGTNPGCP